MKKRISNKSVLMIALLMLLSSSIIPLTSGIDEERLNALDIQIEQPDETTIQLHVAVPEVQLSSVFIEGTYYTSIDLENAGRTFSEGKAKIPIIRRMIEIPQGSDPVISISSSNWEDIILTNKGVPGIIEPVQPLVDKTDPISEFAFDDEYYSSDSYFPEETVRIDGIYEVRGRRFVVLEIAPVLYNPVQSSLKVLINSEIIIDVSVGFDLQKTVESMQRYSSSSFEELYQQIFLNYGYYEQLTDTSKDPEGYLIIVYDDFSDEIAPLASWKTGLGYDVTVTLTSEIPGGATNSNIKAYIEEAYDTWAIPPSYILLVGDTPQIPPFTSNGGATDTPFVTMDADTFADIYIGRFPAATETHVTSMVDKTIYYEQGDFESYDWIKKAAFLASTDNYQISEGTHNYVIDTHLEPNGYTCDKLYTVTYSATTADVTNAINDGRSLVIYSGHGGTTYWADGPYFTQSNVNALTNQGMYPFVCSHACITGKFEVSECFGETWLRASDKAAIAFWGSSINTQWDPDDVIERRVFDAWWDLDLGRIGQMTDKGMYEAYMEYGSGMGQFINSYNVLGDASIELWRDLAGNYDVYQDSYDRGFPIRHAIDGDWAAAQSFQQTFDNISGVDIYVRKFGTPEFDMVVELREDAPDGTLLDSVTFSPEEVSTSWGWLSVDFADTPSVAHQSYFIVIPPVPSGVTTSFGYEWGYAFGNKYDSGSFWFTRDGGGLWRDLPNSYEFTFRTY